MRGRDLEDRGYALKSTGAMALGDVSWHHGWTLHCAGGQPPGSRPRLALALKVLLPISMIVIASVSIGTGLYVP